MSLHAKLNCGIMETRSLFLVLIAIAIVYARPNFHFEIDDDEPQAKYASVVLDPKTKEMLIKDGKVVPYVSCAAFKNTMNNTGWSLLKVSTNGSYSDVQQAVAAGMVEGYITAEQISMAYQNQFAHYCDDKKEFCDKFMAFVSQNAAWIQSQIEANPKSSYWLQVALLYQQFSGLQIGYHASKVKPDMSWVEFSYFQFSGDMEDLEQALTKKPSNKKVVGSGSCSALVKLFEKNQDLAISQVTWNDFNAMLRIYKMYNFSHHEYIGGPLISGAIASFSSYPGVLYSGDDFYILSSGLVTQETTIGNSNSDLWKYISPQTVLEGVRTCVANRLAKSGNEWCSLFERHNSGTYNNQWMILDYKLFEPGKDLKPDTLWILEQLPGIVHMADQTVLLQQQGYWASYNIPYFPYIYNISGVSASKAKYGSWFDYNLNPRAQIFKRDHGKVSDMQSLVKLMRYNNFKKDPISKCNCTPPYSAENAISARSDLNPAKGTYPFGALGHRRHGGTDCKATSFAMAKKLSQFIVAGPTFDDQPPFQWSKTEWKRPLGHPDIFKFEPLLLDWSLEQWTDHPDEVVY